MDIRIPDHLAGPTFAEGVALSSSGDAVTMTFFVRTSAEAVAVQRIVLSESSLEPFALELGAIAANRKRWESPGN